MRKEEIKKFLKSLIVFCFTLIFISMLTFMLVKLQPGDPAKNYLRARHIAINEETIEHANKTMGFDKPVVLQYMDWLSKAVRGDFGMSYFQKASVSQVIIRSLLPTLSLGFFALIIETILAFFLGIIAAIYHGRLVDKAIQMFAFVCVSIPTFWLGYLLIILFSIKLNILPVLGRGGMEHMILPAVTLMFPILGKTTLFIRNIVMGQMHSEHSKNAILRGVNRKYVIFNHLLKNSSAPIITIYGSDIMYLISGSVLIEEIFAWPGLGRMFVAAVKTGDLPVIQGSLLLFGVMAVVINALTQWFIHFMNPETRVRLKEERRMKYEAT